jgi:hypothetical protein
MKNTVQLCLDAARVRELDTNYCREWWTSSLLNNGSWPAAIAWALNQLRANWAGSLRGLEGWFLAFAVLEREQIEQTVARLNRDANTEPLPMAKYWDGIAARSAAARP